VRYDVHVLKGERTAAAASVGSGAAKLGRVVVRNVHFRATAADLATAFTVFGPLSEVHIPTVSMPKHFKPVETKQQSRGFAFVQFLLAADAQAACAKTDTMVCGRAVTVAMAVAKKVYELTDPKPVDVKKKGSGDEDDEDGADDKDGKTDDDQSGDDDDDQSDDLDKEDEDTEAAKGKATNAVEEDEVEEDGANKSKSKAAQKGAPVKKVSRDVAEGRTLFVKNLPFDATEGELRKRFEEFGSVTRAAMVVDGATGLAKGTAFVTFAEAVGANAAACRAALGGFTLQGRTVEALVAVDRSAAAGFGKDERDSVKNRRDRRNLYLKATPPHFGFGDFVALPFF
jgi:nucleolar protein 4